MRTAASGRETSVATSLTRARDANARQRAAFQRFKRDVVTSQEFSGRSSVGTTGRASTTTRAAPKGTNTFIESFFDLADVVAGGRDNAGFSELATRIGDDVYIQVNAWRLYLKDMHFADGLAKVFAVKIADNGNKYDDKIVDEVLGVVRVPLGGGKSDSPLGDLCPSSSVNELKNILRDYVDDRL
jgi:hypothetical protein